MKIPAVSRWSVHAHALWIYLPFGGAPIGHWGRGTKQNLRWSRSGGIHAVKNKDSKMNSKKVKSKFTSGYSNIEGAEKGSLGKTDNRPVKQKLNRITRFLTVPRANDIDITLRTQIRVKMEGIRGGFGVTS